MYVPWYTDPYLYHLEFSVCNGTLFDAIRRKTTTIVEDGAHGIVIDFTRNLPC